MGNYVANIIWHRNNEERFTDQKYSRVHQWNFDGGIQVTASSSPLVVKKPWSMEEAVDPEEAFVAALSSCHMLWFLSIAASAGFCVDHYHDAALGHMSNNIKGEMAMTRVELNPKVSFSGKTIPTENEHLSLHHEAHRHCYLANSVLTEIRIRPELA
ncbi:OsmC family protein [Acerihabitans sp. TG2]|uniref:OsmC family protein n=1 Tax=Acerihabitans sp. TG2 TaxID=3096008 RepID=UPI002B23027A|nr:OsmC family protein [Acerihabitans sp. TG2]MEA9392893.1 OsmC family protein [Acerihabitans sp. TG2]